MKCPVCDAELRRSAYEGLPVFCCDSCHGYLVQTNRVANIKRRREKSDAELAEETQVAGADSKNQLACPRCRRSMTKETAQGENVFQIDKCQTCDVVWFDPGELARLQQNYQATPRAAEALRFQQRHQNMTAEEKAEFEEDLADLPPGDASLLSAFGHGLAESWNRFWRDRSRY